MTVMRRAYAAFLGRESAFELYYARNVWGDRESASGPGSRRSSMAVRATLNALQDVTRSHGIRSINDIPCGDFNWIDAFLDAHPAMHYRGFDIVADLIDSNRRKAPAHSFDKLDIVTEVPPAADLILCKDLLNHLNEDEVIAAVTNMRASGSRLLLATNNFGCRNVPTARRLLSTSRPVDLIQAPFAYAPPIWRNRYLGLWALEDMVRQP